jgi:hypothetical protein
MRVFDWVQAEGHSGMKSGVTIKRRAIGHFQVMIVSCEFYQWKLPDPIIMLIINKILDILFYDHIDSFSLAIGLGMKCS